jgi:hypothetical protein
MIIYSSNWGDAVHFSAHHPGNVDMVIGEELREAIRRDDGPIILTVAAAEDLLTNLQVNVKYARAWARVAQR